MDVILENDKFKNKLLLTNVKNVKNGQYYQQVIAEVKERCKEREEEFGFTIPQTRQKFMRCINMCRDALMKVKTASGIKRFQEDKELGNWFNKLMPVISSMDNCQPQQAIEFGTESLGANDEESDFNDFDEQTSSSGSSNSSIQASTSKRKSFVLTPKSAKKSKVSAESVLSEIKDTMNTIKELAADTSSKDMLDFLKEESQRQAARDDAFLKILGTLVQQPQSSQLTQSIPEVHSQFQANMPNLRPMSGMTNHISNVSQNFNGSQQDMSFLQQLSSPNFP